MHILVIGSGGREHALVYALNKSPSVGKIYAAPGNGGINKIAIKAEIDIKDFSQIADFCTSHHIGLVIIGPEDPLVAGMADFLTKAGIKTFGPSAAAAKIEGSKQFMKDCAKKYQLNTAQYANFNDPVAAKNYVYEKGAPIVIKTDGLAAGKGVIMAQTETEAYQAIDEMFEGRFGESGKKIVIEEFLYGEEASFFAICDGQNAIAFGSAQDHKAVGEGDTGPNTGGMGTYAPAPVVTDVIHQQIMDTIINPFIKGMADDGNPYVGVLFAGVMIKDGEAKLLEFNVRFGDPECQVLMARLDCDILPILLAACDKKLDEVTITFKKDTALCVVMASKGYPGSYEKDTEIKNLEVAELLPDTIIYHAGTKYQGNRLLATGGRVLGVTALGKDVAAAQKKAYQAVDLIDWNNGFCRRDIGWRAVERLKK